MLSPCRLHTAAADTHAANTDTLIPLLLADPRQNYPATVPQFEGQLVAVKCSGSGYVTLSPGLCYLLIGIIDGGTLDWGPVNVISPYQKLDCTGNPWTAQSWLLCGLM